MSAMPNYKDVVDLLKKGMTVEAQEKIVELREEALEIQEENLRLKARVKELEKELELRGKVVWESPYYWLENEGNKEGPFCQHCYDKDKKLIRLQNSGGSDLWFCQVCQNGVRGSKGSPPNLSDESGGVSYY